MPDRVQASKPMTTLRSDRVEGSNRSLPHRRPCSTNKQPNPGPGLQVQASPSKSREPNLASPGVDGCCTGAALLAGEGTKLGANHGNLMRPSPGKGKETAAGATPPNAGWKSSGAPQCLAQCPASFPGPFSAPTFPFPLPLPHSHSPSLSSFLLPQAAPASLACSRRRLELLHFTLLLVCAHTEEHALVGHRTRLYPIHVLIIDIFPLISTSPAKNNRPAPAARQTSPPSYRAPRSLNLPPHDETACLPPNSSTAERFSTSTLRPRP
jgi:hypothetical protein